jgi:catechol 2,3-dioxygenase-like lactoylglutathione lyase family enzyme
MAHVSTIDHFVVPVDDLPVAEEFYTRVLGAPIVVRHGLNVRERAKDVPLHTFVEIAGKRIGLFLQTQMRPRPTGLRGVPSHALQVTVDQMEQLITALRREGVAFEGPVEHPPPYPIAASLYLCDPAGNHLEFCIWRQ